MKYILYIYYVTDKYDLSYIEEKTKIPQMFIRSEETPIKILKILKQNK
jgi:hypothetical protein